MASELKANKLSKYTGSSIELGDTLVSTDTNQDVLIGGKLAAGRTTEATEQLYVSGTANITGATTLGAATTVSAGGLTVTGGITSASGGLTVTGATSTLGGATSVAGLLTVSTGGATITGATTVSSGGLTVAGGLTVSNTGLTVTTGATTFGAATTVSAGGLDVSGGLIVDGEAITGGSTGTNYIKAFAKITYDFSGPTATVNANSNVNGVVISQTDHKITITFTTGIGNADYVVMMNSTQDGLEGSGTTLIHNWHLQSQVSGSCEVRLRGGENADAGVLHFTVMSA